FQDRVASEVFAYVNEQELGSTVEIDAVVKGDTDPAKVKQEIADELADLRDKGPTADEVERAQRAIESERLAGLENIASRAAAIASWTALTGDPDHLGAELDMLRAVTKDGVQASVKKWMGEKAAVTMIVTGKKK